MPALIEFSAQTWRLCVPLTRRISSVPGAQSARKCAISSRWLESPTCTLHFAPPEHAEIDEKWRDRLARPLSFARFGQVKPLLSGARQRGLFMRSSVCPSKSQSQLRAHSDSDLTLIGRISHTQKHARPGRLPPRRCCRFRWSHKQVSEHCAAAGVAVNEPLMGR